MKKLRVIIADDERPAREFLKTVLGDTGMADLAGEAGNGVDAVALIREVRPDLALLDLQMPGMGGIDVVRQLEPEELPLIAFVTAFDDMAVRAFELNAIDYLLKPVERPRVVEMLTRAEKRLSSVHWREEELSRIGAMEDTFDPMRRTAPIERIPVKVRDDIRLIAVPDIASIVANGELLQIVTSEGQKYVINFRLKDLEARLDKSRFLRVSRGAIVNMDHVDSFSPLPGGTYSINLTNGQEITSSRQQSRILREKLLKI